MAAAPAGPDRPDEAEIEAAEPSEPVEAGEEAVHTVLWTAATERPVEEVVGLVARLKETGEMSSPADVALRAAAVSRPLDEVRQLVELLGESGYDLRQAETTLRAAAVGRPIEDVVALVNILGSDDADTGRRKAGPGPEGGEKTDPRDGRKVGPIAAAVRKRRRGPSRPVLSPLDGALAAGPGSHTASPELRSALRWPAALALFACGLIHLPTDLAGLRSGGFSETLSVVVTALCLVCGVWLAARDTLVVWAAAAGLAVGVIALHVVASVRTVDLLDGSLGATFAWAKATALLSGAAVVALAGSTLLRHTRAPAPPPWSSSNSGCGRTPPTPSRTSPTRRS
ncbi:hypothetical protein AB0C77_04740, partial [Streptomyces sp. NPDC048629]|uniref:hypothetical protein n=1 Tax=Streptomyces sp. NPDC048629 TaxID=3154824 RepID=UPI00342E4639